jgi:UDP-N-acetylglucosamine--N-acetylmuramyl-(pentapeptide) pyrophosphoryl-undecaprenol N-acetylglucosamine transferase
MRLIIAGGGTGGHLFCGIAVAEKLRELDSKATILFVGGERKLESEIVLSHGFKFERVCVLPLKGEGPREVLRGSLALVPAIYHSIKLIRRFKPNVIFGLGGFLSGPLVLAGIILRVKTAICEQNVIPGLTNRVLGHLVSRVFLSFEESEQFFPYSRLKLVGNPIREVFSEIRRDSNRSADLVRLLVLGGSQGSQTLNRLIPYAIATVKERCPKQVFVVHQAGTKDMEEVREYYKVLGIKAKVYDFIKDIAIEYSLADLVISRAGATTIAEICCMGKPSVMIPYPYAADNHQVLNARVMEKRGCSIVIEESNLSAIGLGEVLWDLIRDQEKREVMSQKAKGYARPNAAKAIVEELEELAGV